MAEAEISVRSSHNYLARNNVGLARTEVVRKPQNSEYISKVEPIGCTCRLNWRVRERAQS